MTMVDELQRAYRPTKLKDVVGQTAAVSALRQMIKKKRIPKALLFHGPSGCGKTTLARIVASALECSEMDFEEINVADKRGVDDIRAIATRMRLSPMQGPCRVFLLDECHRLTSDAQAALLKHLEDPPRRVWFMLATTDPQKLLSTVRGRCTDFAVGPITDADLEMLIERIAAAEKITLSDEVKARIVECADGSARRAVVSLATVQHIKDETEQLDLIERSDERRQAIDLVRILMNHKKANWSEVAAIIKAIPDAEAEGFRRLALKYATSCMIGAQDKAPPKSPNKQAYKVIVAFSENFFDTGRAGLVAACCDVLFN